MEMTEKLFYKEPYLSGFEAKVISCREGKKGWEIILDQTAFYPEGGGQPGDLGYLDDVRILDTRETSEGLIHLADGPLEAGRTVKGKIDWERRFELMQQHTGEHIFSGIVNGIYGYDNVGFHMGKDCVTVDFNGVLDWNQTMEIEKLANEKIYENV